MKISIIRLVLTFTAVVIGTACAGTTPKPVTVEASAMTDKLQDPWQGQPPLMRRAPALTEGPAKIVGKTLFVSTAYHGSLTMDARFISCSQAYVDGIDTGWSCNIPATDVDGDGWVEIDFSMAVTGVYDLTVRATEPRTLDIDVTESWPSYLGRLTDEAKRFVRCTTTDNSAVCLIRVAVDQNGISAAGHRDIVAELAAKAEAEAVAAAQKAEEALYPQEFGAVELPPIILEFSLDQVSSEPASEEVTPEAKKPTKRHRRHKRVAR